MRRRDDLLFKRIVDYVNQYFEYYGRSPATREIAQGICSSRPTVQRYLKAMEERGEIEYDGLRGIVTEYMKEFKATTRVQKGSTIPCGQLTEVTDAEIEHMRLPIALTGPGEFFLLRAKGNSMINVGINKDDLVLIRTQKCEPKEGQIVAFLYQNDKTTLKRFHRVSRDEVHLMPENNTMKPIIIKGENLKELRIQGIATMVLKDLD